MVGFKTLRARLSAGDRSKKVISKRLARLYGAGLQYAALPYRFEDGELRILLVTSRQTARWTVPKGWPMKRLSASGAAEREALEEAGVTGTIKDKPVGSYRYSKRLRDGVAVRCTVHVYPLQVSEERAQWPEMSQRVRQWCTREEASARVEEPELKALLLTFSPNA